MRAMRKKMKSQPKTERRRGKNKKRKENRRRRAERARHTPLSLPQEPSLSTFSSRVREIQRRLRPHAASEGEQRRKYVVSDRAKLGGDLGQRWRRHRRFVDVEYRSQTSHRRSLEVLAQALDVFRLPGEQTVSVDEAEREKVCSFLEHEKNKSVCLNLVCPFLLSLSTSTNSSKTTARPASTGAPGQRTPPSEAAAARATSEPPGLTRLSPTSCRRRRRP